MQRSEFLKAVTLGIAAVCSGSCLNSCKKGGYISDENSDPEVKEPTATDVSVKDLLNVGDYKIHKGIIFVRTGIENIPSSFIAVQAACTHASSQLTWNQNRNKFVCPTHGSEFNADGTVVAGPAASSLKAFQVTIENGILVASG